MGGNYSYYLLSRCDEVENWVTTKSVTNWLSWVVLDRALWPVFLFFLSALPFQAGPGPGFQWRQSSLSWALFFICSYSTSLLFIQSIDTERRSNVGVVWFGVFIFVVLRVFFNSVVRFYRGSLLLTSLISCFALFYSTCTSDIFLTYSPRLWAPWLSTVYTTHTAHSLGVRRWFTLIFGFWRQSLHQFVFFMRSLSAMPFGLRDAWSSICWRAFLVFFLLTSLLPFYKGHFT